MGTEISHEKVILVSDLLHEKISFEVNRLDKPPLLRVDHIFNSTDQNTK